MLTSANKLEKKQSSILPDIAHHPLFALRERVDRLFDDAFADFPSLTRRSWDFDWPRLPSLGSVMGELNPIPKADVSETNGDYVIRIELPGMTEKDVDVEISGDILTVKGEKKTEREEKDTDYHLRECSYGKVSRSFHIPEPVNEDEVKAEFDSGVLTLTLPKSKKTTTKKISVKNANK